MNSHTICKTLTGLGLLTWGIATKKIEQALGRLADLQRAEPKEKEELL